MKLTPAPFWKHSLAGIVVLGLFGSNGGDAQDAGLGDPDAVDDAGSSSRSDRKTDDESDAPGSLGDDLDDLDPAGDARSTRTDDASDLFGDLGQDASDDPLSDDSTAGKKKRKGRQRRADAFDDVLGADPPAGDVATPDDASQADRGSRYRGAGALPGPGAGLYLDLVNLATSLADAQGDLEIYALKLDHLRELVRQNLISNHELVTAEINLARARRKVQLYGDMARAALRSTVVLRESLAEETQVAKKLYETGTATISDWQRLRSQLVVSEGNIEILESILSHARSTSPRRPKKASAKNAKNIVITIGDDTFLLDGRALPSADELGAALKSFPEERRHGKVEIRISREMPLHEIRAVLETLSKLGFRTVHLETSEKSSSKPKSTFK